MLVAEGDRCLSLEMIVVMVDDWWQLILSLEMIVVMVDGDRRSVPVADDDRSDG
jgi:predicted ABC-type sugar transport system permease subunit